MRLHGLFVSFIEAITCWSQVWLMKLWSAYPWFPLGLFYIFTLSMHNYLKSFIINFGCGSQFWRLSLLFSNVDYKNVSPIHVKVFSAPSSFQSYKIERKPATFHLILNLLACKYLVRNPPAAKQSCRNERTTVKHRQGIYTLNWAQIRPMFPFCSFRNTIYD